MLYSTLWRCDLSSRFGTFVETGITNFRRATHIKSLVDRNESQATKFKPVRMKIPKIRAKMVVRRRRRIKHVLRIN